MRQGPHQAAQKSTKTISLLSRVWAKLCWVMSMVAIVCGVLFGALFWVVGSGSAGSGGGEAGAGPGGHAAGHGVGLVSCTVEGFGHGGTAVAAAADRDDGHG